MKMQKPIYLFFALLFFVVLAFQASAATTARGNELNARFAHLQCRVDLVGSQAANVAQYATSPNLDKLNQDMTSLKTYADAGDVTSFNKYVKDTLTPEYKAVKDGVAGARDSVRAMNLTAQQKTSLRNSWKTNIETFAECNANTRRDIVDKRKIIITDAVTQWEKEVTNMKSKGIDTAQAEQVIADATTLTTLLDDSLKLTDDDAFKQKLDEINDLHLHIWARFHVARLTSYENFIDLNATAAGYGTKITQIKTLLQSASDMAKPGKKYAEGEFKQTWQNIKDAQELLRNLVKDLKTK
jgi:hypothetical protein